MTRRFTTTLCMAALAGLILADQLATPMNPFRAPPAFALGSGLAATGGFCGNLPD